MASTDPIRAIAGTAAHEQMQMMDSQSKLKRHDDQIHEYSWSDIGTEKTIGMGFYCQVYRVQLSSKEFVDKRYALKCLSSKTMSSSDELFRQAAIDLGAEGEILSRLHHENVIKLHGVKSGEPNEAYVDSGKGYFLLLELLDDTLTSRLQSLRKKRSKRNLFSKGPSLSAVLDMVENVAIGIAKGMEYLHQQGVVVSDLKPDNVGFDEKGKPKIFDLGFAREVHTITQGEIVGSLRYMAPEVALGYGASFASDVHSFGVLLYELCTLEKPFKKYKSREEFMDTVVYGNFRPSVSSIPSEAIRNLIRGCWDENPKARPDFSRIVKVLQLEVDIGSSLNNSSSSLSSLGSLTRRSSMDSSNSLSDSASLFKRRSSVCSGSSKDSVSLFKRRSSVCSGYFQGKRDQGTPESSSRPSGERSLSRPGSGTRRSSMDTSHSLSDSVSLFKRRSSVSSGSSKDSVSFFKRRTSVYSGSSKGKRDQRTPESSSHHSNFSPIQKASRNNFVPRSA
jgi:serine/threonine protein kinase